MVGAAGVGFAVLAAAALALQSIAVRASSRTERIVDVIAAVFVVNIVVLVPAAAAVHGTDVELTVALGAFAVSGILGSLLARVALFVGVARLGPSHAESLKSTFPLVAVGAAFLGLGEQVTPSLLAGAALVVVGAATVSWDARRLGGRAADVRFPLAAAFLLGIDPVFTKVGFAAGTPPLVGVTVRVLAAAAGFGLYLGWRGARRGDWPRVPRTRWVGVAALANTLYLVAYLVALSHVPVSVATPVVGASPLLVLVGSFALSGGTERLTPRLVLGVLVLVGGVTLVLVG